MATGKASDFKVYNEYFYSGVIEAIAQQINGFNAASQNTLVLKSEKLKGDYAYTSYFNGLASIVSRRDTTSVSAQTPTALTQAEIINVKLNRKYNEMAMTRDAWMKVGSTPQEMSFILGQIAGRDKMQEMLNVAIKALRVAGAAQSDLYADVSGASTTTMTATNLLTGLKKMGDKMSAVQMLVMHSKVYGDLMGQAIADKVYGEAGLVVYGAAPGTFGRPVLVTDCAGLVDGTHYYTLGLPVGAAVVNESETEEILFERVGGLENIVYRFQGDYAYNLELKGYSWDVANGGANPNTAALATASNWDLSVTSYKNAAGIVINSL